MKEEAKTQTVRKEKELRKKAHKSETAKGSTHPAELHSADSGSRAVGAPLGAESLSHTGR